MPRADRQPTAANGYPVPLQPTRDTSYRKGGSQYDTSAPRKLSGVPNKAPAPSEPANKQLVKTVKTFEAPEYIKGIKHIIEGFSGIQQKELFNYQGTSGTHKIDTSFRKGGSQYDYSDESFKAMNNGYIDPKTGYRYKPNKGYNRRQKQEYDALVSDFKRRQKLRQDIPSLPDSEALQLDGQKAASRRRMRGYTGTLLSKKETLG